MKSKFKKDKLVVICPPGHAILNMKNVTLKTLPKYPLLLRETGSGTREIFDYAMRIRGLAYQPIWESVSTQALVQGVRNGIGLSVLPEKMVEEDLRRHNVCAVPIKEKLLSREYYVITHKHKHLSDEASALIDLIKQEEKSCIS